MDPARARTVVLAAGHARRMGFDKLTASFDGVPLARRVVGALHDLRPLVVATSAVAAVLAGLDFAELLVTEPTSGRGMTLALADAVVPPELHLAVVPCDVPFLDASRVRAFVERVPGDVDLAWPEVGGTPGHPVLWSPAARRHIAGLRADEAPNRARFDSSLRSISFHEQDDAYVVDVDTPAAWAAAERRARGAGG